MFLLKKVNYFKAYDSAGMCVFFGPYGDFEGNVFTLTAGTARARHRNKKARKSGLFLFEWWANQGSNLGPSGYEPGALPTELLALS